MTEARVEALAKEYENRAYPGPMQALCRKPPARFVEGASFSGDSVAVDALRKAISSFDRLHDRFWESLQCVSPTDDRDWTEFLARAQLAARSICCGHGHTLLAYVRKYDTPLAPHAQHGKLLEETPAGYSSEVNCWLYLFGAILDFLSGLATVDSTLQSWDDHGGDSTNGPPELLQILKEHVKYTPERLAVLQHIRATCGWEVRIAIFDAREARFSQALESSTIIERAAYSRFVSWLQARPGGAEAWPEHMRLLVTIAKRKAKDLFDKEYRRRRLTTKSPQRQLDFDPPARPSPSIEDEITLNFLEKEELMNDLSRDEVFRLIEAYQDTLSIPAERQVIERIARGKSYSAIEDACRVSKGRIRFLEDGFLEFLRSKLEWPSISE